MSVMPEMSFPPTLGAPSANGATGSDGPQEATTVALLDWQGNLVWVSSENPRVDLGRPGEFYVREEDRAKVAEAMVDVVKHRRSHELNVVGDQGGCYRVWMWPLDSPDVAVCALCIHVPDELALLTSREQDCLSLLAHGWSASKIAKRLNIAVSTVHTHFRRSREKLNLPSLEALISFAARHSHTFPDSAGKSVD
jgi:DNA-binding CsgD family transcriptional regulator